MTPPFFAKHESVCTVCDRIFSSVSAFDVHLVPLPGRGCVDPGAVFDRKGRSRLVSRVRTAAGASREVWVLNGLGWAERSVVN